MTITTKKILIGAGLALGAYYVWLFKVRGGAGDVRGAVSNLADQLIDPYAGEDDTLGGTIQIEEVIDTETGESSGPGDLYDTFED